MAVVALAPGAQPVVLDGPPRSAYGNTAFDLLVDDAHVAIVPDDTMNAPATVSLLELASGNVAQVPMTAAQGSWFGSIGPVVGGGASLLTGAGTLVMMRAALTKDASGSYVNDYHVWTVDPASASPTPADGGRIATVPQTPNQMQVPEIFALPHSSRFVVAMPHAGQSGAYDLTLALP